ncbi:MAG TPA: hypothetical protein VHO73_01450 [Methylomirabilota bacterium]|jgi:acyl-coenzyme A synthetase/AMP-(fatty) acid ligase|nr:hypothetical protein [Methylomirabilota bacterium]
MGTIPSSFLPSRALWPERVYTLPKHARYPERLNSTEELIDRHKLPREVAFVPQLPRAPSPAGQGTGKLLRRVLREQAGRA